MTVRQQTAGNNPNPNIRPNLNNRAQPPRRGLNRQAPVRGDEENNVPHPSEPQQIKSNHTNPVPGGGRKSRNHRKSHKQSKKTHRKN
jgi:hypothetical protein